MAKSNQGTAYLLVVFLVALTGAASMAILVSHSRPVLALLPPLLLPALVFLWHKPEYGYYMILALIPLDAWRNALEGKFPFLSASKLVGVWVLFVLLAKGSGGARPRESLKTTMWIPLAVLALVAVVSSLFSRWFPDTILELKKMFTAYLVFGLTLYFIRERHFRVVFPAVLIGSVTLTAALGIVGRVFQIESLMMEMSGEIKERVVGVSADPNFFAAMLLCSIPFIVHFFFSAPTPRMRLLMAALFVHNSAAIFLTYSRAGILLYALMMLAIGAQHVKRIRPKHFGFVLLGVGIAAAFGFTAFTRTDSWKRMETLSNPAQDLSLIRRLSYVKFAAELFKEHPVMGSGLGAFPLFYERSVYGQGLAVLRKPEQMRRHAHNTYLDVLVGTGLAGLACFLAALFLSMRSLSLARKRLNAQGRNVEGDYVRAVQYAFVGFLLALAFISDFYHKYIWIFLALSVVSYRHSEKEGIAT